MRRLLFASFLVLRACTAIPAVAEDIGNDTVCFVPGPDDCALVAVAEIAKAQRTLDVQSYNFTEPHIEQALIEAHQRGVQVRLISDKTGPSERGGEVLPTAQAGIPVWIDYKPRIAHNKVIVIDAGGPDAEVLTGSFNWSVSAAQKNSENLLVVRVPDLAAAYEQNFESRLSQSEALADYESAHARSQ